MRRHRGWLLLLLAIHVSGRAELSEGDPEAGRLAFGMCRACHTTAAGQAHGFGPNLHRIFGRRVGTAEQFSGYSQRFAQADFVWTPELLFQWLADPLAMFPGTTMMAVPVEDPKRRADLVAYLRRVSLPHPE
jgi:cytochrome c